MNSLPDQPSPRKPTNSANDNAEWPAETTEVSTKPSAANRLTILQGENCRLAKIVHSADNIGVADALPLQCAFTPYTIESIDDLHETLEELRARPDLCVIRGELIAGTQQPCRRLLKARTENGVHYEPTISDVPRAWIMIDFDSIDEPEDVVFTRAPARCAEHARLQLPAEFHVTRCVWRASGGAGFKPGIRLHLWFLLDRALTGDECKAWTSHAAAKIDRSLFGAVQPHYTADPVLGDVADPMNARIGVLEGANERVAVPGEIPSDLCRTALKGLRKRGASTELRPRPADVGDVADTSIEELDAEIATLETMTSGRHSEHANKVGIRVGGLIARAVWNAGDEPNEALSDACPEYAGRIADACEVQPGNHTHDEYALQGAKGFEFGFKQKWQQIALSAAYERLSKLPLPKRTRAATRTDTDETLVVAQERYDPAGFPLRGVADIFAPMPSTEWLHKILEIASGRVNMFVGFGASGKTFAAQAFALAVATGKPVWGLAPARRGRVVHIDYEQGLRATAKRYQRLAVGLGVGAEDIGDMLQISCMPSTKLTDDCARAELLQLATGAALVVIDSLRASVRGVDENDASIREYLDILTEVSVASGAAFVVIHHAGKSERTDARHTGRGSAAIFDAAGTVLLFDAAARGRKVKVTRTKASAESEGEDFAPLELEFHDVPGVRTPNGLPPLWTGVQVLATQDNDSAAQRGRKKLAELDARVMAVITDQPTSKNSVHAMVGGAGKTAVFEAIERLRVSGRIVITKGLRNADMVSSTQTR